MIALRGVLDRPLGELSEQPARSGQLERADPCRQRLIDW